MAIPADSGGGYAGTNWNGYDIRQMWKIVENQQTDSHWKHVSGWRKTFELTSMHLGRLKEYREKLAESWPPERSPASRAYMARLDYLIGHVQATYDAAVANYDAFAGATGALSTTRHQLKQLYDEYDANQSKLDDYDLQVAAARDPANSGLPQPALGPPPVPNGRQEELNWKARSLMFGLSSELSQARAAIKQPQPYQPPRGREDLGAGPRGGDNAGSGSAPIIPPIVPAPAIPTPPTAATPPRGGTVVSPTAGGPVLGGAPPGTILPAPGTINPVVPTPPAGSTPLGGVIGPVVSPAPPIPRPTQGTGVIGPAPISPMPGPSGGAGSPLRPMPPGGVIGAPVGTAFGPPAAGQSVPNRVNPVGGMIGQRPAATTAATSGVAPSPIANPSARNVVGSPVVAPTSGPSTGRSGPMSPSSTTASRPSGRMTGNYTIGVTPETGLTRHPPAGAPTSARSPAHPYGAMPRRGGLGRSEEHQSRWDPHNPWETDEGVAPVVVPPKEAGKIDPGPSIGSDR